MNLLNKLFDLISTEGITLEKVISFIEKNKAEMLSAAKSSESIEKKIDELSKKMFKSENDPNEEINDMDLFADEPEGGK